MNDYKDNTVYFFHGDFKEKVYNGYDLHDGDYYPFIFCKCKNINGNVKLIVCLGDTDIFGNELIHGNPPNWKGGSYYVAYGNSKDEAWNNFRNKMVSGDYDICSADGYIERAIKDEFKDIREFAKNNYIGDLELEDIFKSVMEEKC